MRLIDGLALRGTPARIPSSTRNELPELFVKLGFNIGAEIGIYKGLFTKRFCDLGLTMYAIDAWQAYPGSGRDLHDQVTQDVLFESTRVLFSPYANCRILRCTSYNALCHFKHDSLDFVYIDADHTFLATAQDIYYWSQKVRNGGIIAGHDYKCFNPNAPDAAIQVGPVVDAYMKAFNIKNWYTFGGSDEESEDGLYDDRNLSWMYFK